MTDRLDQTEPAAWLLLMAHLVGWCMLKPSASKGHAFPFTFLLLLLWPFHVSFHTAFPLLINSRDQASFTANISHCFCYYHTAKDNSTKILHILWHDFNQENNGFSEAWPVRSACCTMKNWSKNTYNLWMNFCLSLQKVHRSWEGLHVKMHVSENPFHALYSK